MRRAVNLCVIPNQAREVLEFSANLNDGNKIIAEHWADGPDTTLPPGHMFYIALGAAEKQVTGGAKSD